MPCNGAEIFKAAKTGVCKSHTPVLLGFTFHAFDSGGLGAQLVGRQPENMTALGLIMAQVMEVPAGTICRLVHMLTFLLASIPQHSFQPFKNKTRITRW